MNKYNPYSDAGQMNEALLQIKSNICPYPFKYISGYISTLGGMHQPTIMLSVSLQSKDEWKYGIMENSPYAHISIDHDGVMEMFSGCIIPKLRKTHVSSTQEVISKLHIWGEKVLMIKPHE
jgi:hypothetical protein